MKLLGSKDNILTDFDIKVRYKSQLSTFI